MARMARAGCTTIGWKIFQIIDIDFTGRRSIISIRTIKKGADKTEIGGTIMLDRNDKKWIIETVDGRLDTKLEEAKGELRGEMQEKESELRGEMQQMNARLRIQMQEMKTELRRGMQEVRIEVYESMQKSIQEKKSEIITEVTIQLTTRVTEVITRHAIMVFENTYQHYMGLFAENVPEGSFETIK